MVEILLRHSGPILSNRAIRLHSTYDGQISVSPVYYCNLELSCPNLGITESHSGSDPEVLINYGVIIFDCDCKLKCNGSFFFRWWRLILETCSVQVFFSVRPFDARSTFVFSSVSLKNFCFSNISHLLLSIMISTI